MPEVQPLSGRHADAGKKCRVRDTVWGAGEGNGRDPGPCATINLHLWGSQGRHTLCVAHNREPLPDNIMVTEKSYLRIYTWHRLDRPDRCPAAAAPETTRIALDQLARLARHRTPCNERLSGPLLHALRGLQEEDPRFVELFDDKTTRALFLSDLYDHLVHRTRA